MAAPFEYHETDTPRRDVAAEPPAKTIYPVSAGETILVPENERPENEARAVFEFSGVLMMVPECRERVMEFVEQHCPDEGDRSDILVAVQEALANAALHGCKDDPTKKICCVVTATPTEIVISVSDAGTGFDVGEAEPEKYQATKLRHGRGICLMRSLMTEVSFAHNGAEVVMRKRKSVASSQ